MAKFIEISDPFNPLKDTHIEVVKHSTTVRAYMRRRYGPRFNEYKTKKPLLCLVNGVPLSRRGWSRRRIRRKDVVNIITVQGYVAAYWIIVALIVVASVVVAVQSNKKRPNMAIATGSSNIPAGDPVYTVRGQNNQKKLGDPIESSYGRVRMWPSYASNNYTFYKDNQQWICMLFCLGQGEYDVGVVNIEDTPADNFQDVHYNIVPPGSRCALFPDNVVTSADVSSVQLYGPNEGSFTGWTGPFVVCGPGKRTTNIAIDVSLVNGLYHANDNGNLDTRQVTAQFQAQQIDDGGVPIGGWFDLNGFDQTLATSTPQRFTIETTVTSGRYQVRGQRSNNHDTSNQTNDQLNWEQLRAFLPSTTDFGNVTMLEFKARATNNLNSNSSNRINVWATRKLPQWDVDSQTWLAPQPTRSLVWAFCDVFRAKYGAQMVDKYLDLDDLAGMESGFADRGELFDWIFDQRTTCWAAAQMISRCGRAVPMLNGPRITMIRDEPQELPTAVFNQENIVAGSFKRQIKLATINEYDGVEVTYTDPDTWQVETVLCLVGSETGDYPEQIKLEGCTSRTVAYRYGMYYRRMTLYARENVVFKTGLEGHIPSYNDLISTAYDVPRWAQGGLVKSIANDGVTVSLTEPVTFITGQTMKIAFRDRRGSRVGPFTVTAGSNSREVVISGSPPDLSALVFEDSKILPLYLFGKSSFWGKESRVSTLTPSADDTVEITSVVYDGDIFASDSATAPAIGNTSGNLTPQPQLPSVTGIRVLPATNQAGMVVVSWNPSEGASSYVLQYSYDSVRWSPIISTADTSSYLSVTPGPLYVRVAAIGIAQGPWGNWSGTSPVPASNVIIDNGNTPAGPTVNAPTPGFNTIWLTWTSSTNAKLKTTHIFASNTTTRPSLPTYSLPFPQSFFVETGLANGKQRWYWLMEESVGGLFSAIAGPYTATTINGVTLDDLIPGGVSVEILGALPATANFLNRTVFLTTDKKLYKWQSSTVTTGTSYWVHYANPVNGSDIVADTVTGGVMVAAAVSAREVGANTIITYTANIADAVITNAKIVSLLADKITAGTITATVALDSPLIASVGACYNTDNPSQKFPTTAMQTGSMGSGAAGDHSLVTFNGWGSGSGFDEDVFGNASGTQKFRVTCSGNFSLSNTTNSFSAQIVYRVNGGGWTTVGDAFIGVNTGSGTFICAFGLGIVLASTDYIEFGIRIGSLINASLTSANMMVDALNF